MGVNLENQFGGEGGEADVSWGFEGILVDDSECGG